MKVLTSEAQPPPDAEEGRTELECEDETRRVEALWTGCVR